jgi:hypothetical protein
MKYFGLSIQTPSYYLHIAPFFNIYFRLENTLRKTTQGLQDHQNTIKGDIENTDHNTCSWMHILLTSSQISLLLNVLFLSID